MSIGGWIFGKDPKHGVDTLPSMTPEQQQTLKSLLGQLGPQTKLSGLENLSLEALEQKIMQQATGESEKTIGESEDALSKMLATGGAPTDFEEFYRAKVRDPAMQEFTEMLLPEITRRYGASGAFGSDRKLAEQQALERLSGTLAGVRGELAFKTSESAQERILKAIGLQPGVTGARAVDTENLLQLMTGTQLPRNIENQRINQILAALGLKTTDNIPWRTEGTSGWLGPSITAFAGGLGRSMGGGGTIS